MEVILALIYLTVFIGVAAALVRTAKRPTHKNWVRLYLTQILLICAAYGLMQYFNNLPGAGMLAGVQYFAQAMYSLCAVILYVILFVISLVVGAVVWLRRK